MVYFDNNLQSFALKNITYHMCLESILSNLTFLRLYKLKFQAILYVGFDLLTEPAGRR